MRIYIAGPISRGNLADNVNQATAAFVELARLGYSPFCPHWSVYSKPCKAEPQPCDNGAFLRDDACYITGTRNGNNEMTHADWLRVDLEWVECADAVLRLPGESTGADMETNHANQLGIPLFHSIEQLVATLKP